jgi:hypothetical protein
MPAGARELLLMPAVSAFIDRMRVPQPSRAVSAIG